MGRSHHKDSKPKKGKKQYETEVVIKKEKKEKNHDKFDCVDRVQRRYDALAKSLQELLSIEKANKDKKKIILLEQQIIAAEFDFKQKLRQAKDREWQRAQLVDKVK